MVSGKRSRIAGLRLLSCTKEHDTLGREVNEGLQERNLDQPLQEPAREPDGMVPTMAALGRGWLGPAYTLELLIGVITIIAIRTEVGRKRHMDLHPRYVKLICVLGSAWCCIGFTAGIV